MLLKLTFCILGSRRQAEDAMHRLESENFSDDHISVIFPDQGAMSLPGIGPYIASGPIVHALRIAAIDTGCGGIACGLAGLGLPKSEARRLQSRIEAGSFLLSVHVATAAEADLAKAIFAAIGAEDICCLDEAGAAESHPAKW